MLNISYSKKKQGTITIIYKANPNYNIIRIQYLMSGSHNFLGLGSSISLALSSTVHIACLINVNCLINSSHLHSLSTDVVDGGQQETQSWSPLDHSCCVLTSWTAELKKQ